MKKHIRFAFILGAVMFLASVGPAGTVSAQQARGMGVEVNALPQELQKLDVQDFFVPSNAREAGVLHGLNGHIVVVHRASGAAYFGKPGDTIYENDALTTLADSRCRIRFYSDDVVNMAPDTHFAIEGFEDRRADREKTSLFSMVKGKAMFYALRLFRYKETRFKVKTPTATVGVRGTKFGLHVFWLDEGRKALGDGIRVAESGRGFEAYLAQAAQGRRSGTVTACGDGDLNLSDPATGKVLVRVGPNEHYNTATQRKGYDPRNRILNGIANASKVREEGEEEPKQPTDGAVEGEGPSGDDTGLPDTTLLGGNQADITQQQTGDEAQGETTSPYLEGSDSYPLYGYFSALLLLSNGDIKDALSSFSLQQLDPTSGALAYGAESTNHWVEANGDDPTWAEVNLLNPPSSGPIRVDFGEYVSVLSYLQWGYDWVSTELFSAGGESLRFVQKAWWLEGYPTCPTELAAMSGNYSYSGDVDGTYYDPTQTVDISGSYSCDVHFGSSYVENFVLNAAGGGHNVSFAQSGQAEIDSLGQFGTQIGSGMVGDFKIDGSSPLSYYELNGAHYGPNAAEQGGAFAGFNDSTNQGAYGVFGGRRQ